MQQLTLEIFNREVYLQCTNFWGYCRGLFLGEVESDFFFCGWQTTDFLVRPVSSEVIFTVACEDL